MPSRNREITVTVGIPGTLGSFAGFYIEVTAEYTTNPLPSLGTSTPLDGTSGLQGVAIPLKFGPFPYADFGASATVSIPAPSAYPVTYQLVVLSYGDGIINPASTSPTTTFVLNKPNRTSGSATAYTRLPTKLLGQTPVRFNTGGTGAAGGVDYTSMFVHFDPPIADPNFQGVVWVLVAPDGSVYWTSTPVTGDTTLIFPTPTTTGTYTVYAAGWDGENANPVVAGLTPSFTVVLGTDGGVLDAGQIPTGSGVSNAGSVLSLKYGAAVADDGSGNITVLAGGPLYKDISGKLNVQLAADFIVSGGKLTQNAVDLAKAYNFGVEFTTGSGVMAVNAIAVNKLLAGTALFAGTATFANASSNAAVQIGSAGITLADDYVGPTSTFTVSASGATVAKLVGYTAWSSGTTYGTTATITYNGLNYVSLQNSNTNHQPDTSPTWWAPINCVQITSAGVGVYGPSGSLTATSGGVVIENGTSSVTITPSSVAIVNGSLTSPTIIGGAMAGTSLTITVGSDTVEVNTAISTPIGSLFGVMVTNLATYALLGPNNLTYCDSSGATGPQVQMDKNQIILVGNSGATSVTLTYLGLQYTGGTGFTGTLAAAIAAGKNVYGGFIY